jgi:hypothetical protein
MGSKENEFRLTTGALNIEQTGGLNQIAGAPV